MKAKDLRNSILQMAVQGKLVPQDPSDEPASALLERIRVERAKLIEEKKIKAPKGGESVIYRASDGSHYEKRGKGEPVCIDDEIPFEIPKNWEWARLESVCRVITDGDHQPPPQVAEGIPFLVISNVSSGSISFENTRFVPFSYFEALDDSRKPEVGDLLFTVTGSFGIPVVVRTDREFCFQRHIALMKPLVDVDYLWWAVQSPAFFNYCDLKATGTAQRTVSLSTLRSGLLPIPPEAEQIRILSFISEVLPYIDQYGALEDARERLDAELPDRLRKSILQLAVQGKLVPQDPSDEPASVLLDHIRAQRTKLVKAGKLKAPKDGESVIYRASDGGYYEKRGKGEPVCIDDEIPFEIPESWAWARLGSILELVSDGTHKTPEYKDSGVLFLSVQNISKGYFDFSKVKYISHETHEELCKRVKPQNRDILLCRIGTLGKPIIIDVDYEFSIFVSLGLLRLIDKRLAEWVVTCIDAPLGFQWIQKVKVGGGTHTFKINLGDIPDFLIPLPPHEEQRRITEAVERFDEL